MASKFRVKLDGEATNVVLKSLKPIYPDASVVGCGDGMYHIQVEPGRFLIVENDDICSDRHQIIRSVVERAKKGDLESVRFLLEYSDFDFPNFKVNGDD